MWTNLLGADDTSPPEDLSAYALHYSLALSVNANETLHCALHIPRSGTNALLYLNCLLCFESQYCYEDNSCC